MCDSKTISCAQCGVNFEVAPRGGVPQIYCSKRCRYIAKDRRRGRRERPTQPPICSAHGCTNASRSKGLCATHYQRLRNRGSLCEAIKCLHCGRQIIGRKKKYCSIKCGETARNRKAGKKPLEMEKLRRKECRVRKECNRCGRLFEPKGPKCIHCSPECAEETKRIRRAVASEASTYARFACRQPISEYSRLSVLRRWRIRADAPCVDCGVRIGFARTRTNPAIRCKDCAELDEKRQKAIYRKARKAKQRGATVERVDSIKVFERDGWVCHLCHKVTMKDKRGTLHPRAPELDHIIPISKGGEHSYANTACSCRRCNAEKSDKIIGQPSLLAA